MAQADVSHDPGKIVLDLAVALALGGDCLADIGVLRAEPAVFGGRLDPTVSRLISALAADAPKAVAAIAAARAAARTTAWAVGRGPRARITASTPSTHW